MYWCEILDNKTRFKPNIKMDKVVDQGLKISNINFIADKNDSNFFLA